MATAKELLSETPDAGTTLTISNDLRIINIPPSVKNIGVESDDEVLRLHFEMPRYIGSIDLSPFSIRINYLNAKGEGDIYTVDDVTVTDDNITFSWLVGPTATRYMGRTSFNVCLRTFITKDGLVYVDREFNTTPATLPVLEGLEVDGDSIMETYPDLLEQWRKELTGNGTNTIKPLIVTLSSEPKLASHTPYQMWEHIRKGGAVYLDVADGHLFQLSSVHGNEKYPDDGTALFLENGTDEAWIAGYYIDGDGSWCYDEMWLLPDVFLDDIIELQVSLGDIDAALDSIIATQNALIGGGKA